MAKPSTIKIDVTKILKQHLFRASASEAVYLDCAIWENRDGPDKFGYTHYVTQSVSKEARNRGEKGAIIGNLKLVTDERPARQASAPPPRDQRTPADPDLDSAEADIPF